MAYWRGRHTLLGLAVHAWPPRQCAARGCLVALPTLAAAPPRGARRLRRARRSNKNRVEGVTIARGIRFRASKAGAGRECGARLEEGQPHRLVKQPGSRPRHRGGHAIGRTFRILRNGRNTRKIETPDTENHVSGAKVQLVRGSAQGI